MKKIRFNDLSEDTRRVLAEAEQDGGLVVEDERGQARSRVYAYREPSEAEREAAWGRLRQWQAKAEASMKKHGVTEDDILRVVLEDD